MEPGRLSGRAAIVTGAAGGIGLAIARRLASEGVRVVIADVQDDSMNAIVADLRALGAPDAIGVVGDLSGEDAARSLLDRSLAAFGAIDTLEADWPSDDLVTRLSRPSQKSSA